LIDVFGL